MRKIDNSHKFIVYDIIQTVNILDCRLGSSARTSTAAVMVTVRQRRPEKAVTRAGAGRGWGEEVSQTTVEGGL